MLNPPTVGSLSTVILAIIGLVAPAKIAHLANIKPDGLTGISEIRATYGGFSSGLGFAFLSTSIIRLYLQL